MDYLVPIKTTKWKDHNKTRIAFETPLLKKKGHFTAYDVKTYIYHDDELTNKMTIVDQNIVKTYKL